jgi:ubiquinone/menaquinone biosynthesis C-methylase UbiE
MKKNNNHLKNDVKDFWNNAACGEELYLKGFEKEDYLSQSRVRYDLEPFIITFGDFDSFKNKRTLEIGVGLGSDHMLLAQAGALLTGVDLTERAINHTKRRFELLNLKSNLFIADAENLPFKDDEFDAVYSYGVLHHSPDTQKCIDEVYRVLKPGGLAKIMVYNKYSLVGYMLWLRYALLGFKPWLRLNDIYDKYLESPGTKAYSYKEVAILLNKFKILNINSPLSHGDLLTSEAGQRHKGIALDIARIIWPRWFFRRCMKKSGLAMLLTIQKLDIV